MSNYELNFITSLFHYSYIYDNKTRSNILKYYKLRAVGEHSDVANAWLNKNESFLENGRKIQKVDLKHPVSEQVLRSFLK